jgi:hypothetical protein
MHARLFFVLINVPVFPVGIFMNKRIKNENPEYGKIDADFDEHGVNIIGWRGGEKGHAETQRRRGGKWVHAETRR